MSQPEAGSGHISVEEDSDRFNDQEGSYDDVACVS